MTDHHKPALARDGRFRGGFDDVFIIPLVTVVFSTMYLYAWKAGLKSSYYLRSRPATRIQQATTSSVKAAPVVTNTKILGLTEGQTVNGSVTVNPNLDLLSGVRKVAYYVDGTFKSRVYSSPFGSTSTGFPWRRARAIISCTPSRLPLP